MLIPILLISLLFFTGVYLCGNFCLHEFYFFWNFSNKILKFRLISFDCIVEVVYFFGRKEIVRLGHTSVAMNSALRLHPVLLCARVIGDLNIEYNESGWHANGYTFPKTDPPPTIEGFCNLNLKIPVEIKTRDREV